jgi:hypothetical protein
MENEITLQFRSLDDLWAFRIAALISYIEMDKENCILICKCSHEYLQLAVKKYGASVIVAASSSE